MRKFVPLADDRMLDAADAEIQVTEPTVEVKESKNRIKIDYSFPGFFLVPDKHEVQGKEMGFELIHLESSGVLSESGKPELPSFGRYVQIPPGCSFELSVFADEPQEFDDVLVSPAQADLLDDNEKPHKFEFDEAAYSEEDAYPSELVEAVGPFMMDGYRVLLVHVRPCQYLASEKKLLAYGSIEVTIDLADGVDSSAESEDEGSDLEGFGNLVLNPGRNIARRLRRRPEPYRRILSFGPEFLIVYHEPFKAAAEQLKRWKERKGIRTELVSMTQIGSTVSDLKTYIRRRRTRSPVGRLGFPSRLRYVLLLGDVDMIPTETITVSPYGPNATDYYYSTRNDPSDLNDLVFPWLSIGRIPVRDLAQATSVVKQIIRYECNPTGNSDYYDHMTFAAYFQDDEGDGRANRQYMKTLEDIRQHMVSIGFDIERVYVSNNSNPQFYRDGSPVSLEVKNAIVDGSTATQMLESATADGRMILAHRDHGSKEGWAHPSFTRNHLAGINTTNQSIFFSLNCQTGWFDRLGGEESFAETLLRMNGAAPSLVAATRNSHSFLNDDLMKALFDALWAGVLPTFPGASTASYGVRNGRLGDILNYAKSYLPIGLSGSTSSIKDHLEIYHVVGDPTLEVWKEEPKSIRLAAKVIRRFGSTKPQLSIKLSECPVGSVVTIWYWGKLVKRIQPRSTHMMLPVSELEQIRIPPRPIVPRFRPPLEVCFSAPGYRHRSTLLRI